MRNILGLGLGLGLALALALAPTAALADRSYTSEKQIQHDCDKEGDVSINVSGATAAFTGTCTKISVNGAQNKVTIAAVKKLKVNGAKNTVDVTAADEISATGLGNTITYKKSISGKQTKVKSPGLDNKITEVKP
jgi:polyribonucleotide nucleotidyltransferase